MSGSEPTAGATCKQRLQVQQGGNPRPATTIANFAWVRNASPCATVKHSLIVRSRDQAQRRTLTMRDWEDKLDAFLQFNERELLTHAGTLRTDVAEKLALEHYESFDAARREAARLAADESDIAELQDVQKAAAKKQQNKGGQDE